MRSFSAVPCALAIFASCLAVACALKVQEPAERGLMRSQAGSESSQRRLLTEQDFYCFTTPGFTTVTESHSVLPDVDIDTIPYAKDHFCYKCVPFRSVTATISIPVLVFVKFAPVKNMHSTDTLHVYIPVLLSGYQTGALRACRSCW